MEIFICSYPFLLLYIFHNHTITNTYWNINIFWPNKHNVWRRSRRASYFLILTFILKYWLVSWKTQVGIEKNIYSGPSTYSFYLKALWRGLTKDDGNCIFMVGSYYTQNDVYSYARRSKIVTKKNLNSNL